MFKKDNHTKEDSLLKYKKEKVSMADFQALSSKSSTTDDSRTESFKAIIDYIEDDKYANGMFSDPEAYDNVIEKYGDKDKMSRDDFLARLNQEEEIIKKQKKLDMKSRKIIKTARSLQEINDAVEAGYTPLIEKVIPSPLVSITKKLVRDPETGKIKIVQYGGWGSLPIETSYAMDKNVIDTYTYYPYPYSSSFPFAAYLLPNDLKIGDNVILEDLIVDFVGAQLNSISYRLESIEAIWDGEEFKMDIFGRNITQLLG